MDNKTTKYVHIDKSDVNKSDSEQIDTPEQILKLFLIKGDYRIDTNEGLSRTVKDLTAYYHSQTEKVLREVIGLDVGTASDLSVRSMAELVNAIKAEQRQRAANLGYNVTADKEEL